MAADASMALCRWRAAFSESMFLRLMSIHISIRAETGRGRTRAQSRDVRFGGPPKLNSHQRQEALQRLAAGETQADIARTFGVDATTIGRLQPDGGRPFGWDGASVAA